MAMRATNQEWTVDLLDAMPESADRFEIIDGELFVTPSPGRGHQTAVLVLASRLLDYTTRTGIGRAVISPSDVRFGDERRNRVQPDIYVVGTPEGRRPVYPFHLAELLLAIEVVSPGCTFVDYELKRRLNLSKGVGECWVVDVDGRLMTRFTPMSGVGERITRQLSWTPAGATEPFALDCGALFDLR